MRRIVGEALECERRMITGADDHDTFAGWWILLGVLRSEWLGLNHTAHITVNRLGRLVRREG